jgi:iron complex transport system ATP-binding protein
MSQPIIDIRNLTVRREQTILDEINWSVSPGEHWCILGANGSGKTSLLRTLMACFAPTSGSIILFGKEYSKYDWREMRKHIGMVSSHLTQRMDRSLSVLDTVLGGKEATLNIHTDYAPTDEAGAIKALKRVECEHLCNRNWLHLSQGEKQRVLIARALILDLSVLILDEPCAGLDPVARERFLSFVQDLAQHSQSPTLILVTHHVEEIVPAISHLLFMKSGQVLASGVKQKLLNSKLLSQTFDAEIELITLNHRYHLKVDPSP